MKILILDRYDNPRDLAQMDMYQLIAEKHEVIYTTEKTIYRTARTTNFDALYLGIYHVVMPLNWHYLSQIVKNRLVLIDQADNEDFAFREVKNIKGVFNNSRLLSRYLPNKAIEQAWDNNVFLLPWYINSGRFYQSKKVINVSFVGTMKRESRIDRIIIAEKIKMWAEDRGLSYKIGEQWGENYVKTLAESQVAVMECDRLCLTQKYLEAVFSGCGLIGDVPEYPKNELSVFPLRLLPVDLKRLDESLDFNWIRQVHYNRNYLLDTFCNKRKFWISFVNILIS